MNKSPDAFRTISEVAAILEVPAHVLRFWETRFTQVRPVKRAGGRRYYRPDDILLLSGVKALLHDQGLTIKGVQKLLKEQGVRHVAALATLPASWDRAWEDDEGAPPAAPAPAPVGQPATIVESIMARALGLGPSEGDGGGREADDAEEAEFAAEEDAAEAVADQAGPVSADEAFAEFEGEDFASGPAEAEDLVAARHETLDEAAVVHSGAGEFAARGPDPTEPTQDEVEREVSAEEPGTGDLADQGIAAAEPVPMAFPVEEATPVAFADVGPADPMDRLRWLLGRADPDRLRARAANLAPFVRRLEALRGTGAPAP